MPTPFYPLIAEKVRNEFLPLKDRIMAWRFFNANGIDTTTHDGKRVALSGIKFSGSPQQVFWSGFFEPFMVTAATNTLQWVSEQSLARNLPAHQYLEEAKFLIQDSVRSCYRDIARTDQLLRGGGFPHSVQPRNVSQKTEQMVRYVDELAIAVGHHGPAPIPPGVPDDIVEIKPNFMGIGLNLNAALRKLRRRKP